MSEAFTDNSGLVPDNQDRNSDFTTKISPGLAINGAGGRTSLDLNYNFNQTFYHRDTKGDQTNNALAAVGQIELWKRIFFIDGQASISRVIEDGTQPSSDSSTGENVNRTEARTFNVSPFFRQHFGQWLETETRVTGNKTTTESRRIEDALTRTGTFTVNGGRRFAIFPWSVVASDRKTQYNGVRPSDRERRVDGSLSYVLDRRLSLTGTVGWEDVNDPGLLKKPKGMTWSGGFTARPSSRTSLQFSYGERNDNRTINASASHRLSVRTFVNASFTDSIQTSQNLIAQTLLTGGLTTNPDSDDVPFLNAAGVQFKEFGTGDLVFQNASTQLGLSESTFRQQVFRLGFSGTRRRNSFNGGGFYEERFTELTGITETNYGGNFSISRRLSNRLNGSLGLSVQMTDFGTPDKREDIDYGGSASLSYQVRNDIQARLSYNLTLTKVNNAPDDLLENSVSLGLTKSF